MFQAGQHRANGGRVAGDLSSSDWSFRHTLMLIGALFCMFALGECVGPEHEFKRDRFHDTLTLSDGRAVKVDIEVMWREVEGWWRPYYSIVEVKGPDGSRLAPAWLSKRRVLPILLDVLPDKTGLILVTAPTQCDVGWVEIGRPVLPYAAFRVEAGRWVRTPLPAALHGVPSNIAIRGKQRWTFTPERLLLLRSPILKDEVFSLTRVGPDIGWSLKGYELRVQGRNAICEVARPTQIN